jgi:hypothetical protein
MPRGRNSSNQKSGGRDKSKGSKGGRASSNKGLTGAVEKARDWVTGES